MKIKDGFLLREVAGNYIVVATGARAKEFSGVVKLNETGSFLWKNMTENVDKAMLAEALTHEYDVDIENAANDVEAFINTLNEAGIIE